MKRCCAIALVLAACTGEGLKPGDAGVDLAPRDLSAPPDFAPPRRDPTDHPPLLQLTNDGGPVVSAMELYAVVWPGDESLGAEMNQFHQAMLTSDYWTSRLAQYGVGAGRAAGVLVLPGPAPSKIDDSEISALIVQKLASGEWQADANTVFAFFPPMTTEVTEWGWIGCTQFGGYHSETSTRVPYIVNLRCEDSIDLLTVVASHEAAECATDAHVMSAPGWIADQAGEIADLCVGGGWSMPSGADGGPSSYVVSKLYSNADAALGDVDPCGPHVANEPFFGAALAPSAITLTTDANGTGDVASALEPFSYSPTLGVIHWQIALNFGDGAPGLSVLPVKGTSIAGDTIPLTFHAGPTAQPGTYSIMIVAQSGSWTTTWWGALTVQ